MVNKTIEEIDGYGIYCDPNGRKFRRYGPNLNCANREDYLKRACGYTANYRQKLKNNHDHSGEENGSNS